MLNREVWTKQRRLPKILCYLKRRYLQIGPPGNFVDLSVQLLMMIPARRHRKLVTDFAPERSRLREFEVVGITGRALANETRLRRDEGEMGLVVATNVRGVFVAIQASSPHLMEGGRIITIGSNTTVRTAFPGASAYSMTKGAVASLVRGIAIDLAPRGITVNKVAWTYRDRHDSYSRRDVEAAGAPRTLG